LIVCVIKGCSLHGYTARWLCIGILRFSLQKCSLKRNECILHTNFVENYNCKYSDEIQSVHFSDSHAQATLYNAVCDFRGSKTVTFCKISDSRSYDSPAIWAYLDPVLSNIQSTHPEVNTVHFLQPMHTIPSKAKFLSFLYQIIFSGNHLEFLRGRSLKGTAI